MLTRTTFIHACHLEHASSGASGQAASGCIYSYTGRLIQNAGNTGNATTIYLKSAAHSADDEFVLVQFHPTGFYTGELGQTFLISEAVRGEGGHLLNLDGLRFMEQYDERLELAPRDVVARSIHDQVIKNCLDKHDYGQNGHESLKIIMRHVDHS